MVTQYEHWFVKSYGWYEHDDALCIAMEYLRFGDLEQAITKMPPMVEKDASTIIAQVLEGLHFMHDNDFTHRDLKPRVCLFILAPHEAGVSDQQGADPNPERTCYGTSSSSLVGQNSRFRNQQTFGNRQQHHECCTRDSRLHGT